jgi:hypothetical protein
MIVRYNKPINHIGGMQQFWGYSHYLRVSPFDVNSKLRLSLNEEKTCAALTSILIEYKFNMMTKRYY